MKVKTKGLLMVPMADVLCIQKERLTYELVVTVQTSLICFALVFELQLCKLEVPTFIAKLT